MTKKQSNSNIGSIGYVWVSTIQDSHPNRLECTCNNP